VVKCNHRWWIGAFAAWLCMPAIALAELTVIYDSGNTRPIAPYLEAFGPADEMQQPGPPPAAPQLGAADAQSLLPIKSPGLTPGPVQARQHDKPFSRPFFLIGSDSRSRQWLRDHGERLREIGAVGMLVQAETLEDLRSIAQLADGNAITPASASDIAKALGISHYPVLITSQGIEQ
jgi:integrating conjugative element protein (TIGR03765 family)